jgi:hypothetical protein
MVIDIEQCAGAQASPRSFVAFIEASLIGTSGAGTLERSRGPGRPGSDQVHNYAGDSNDCGRDEEGSEAERRATVTRYTLVHSHHPRASAARRKQHRRKTDIRVCGLSTATDFPMPVRPVRTAGANDLIVAARRLPYLDQVLIDDTVFELAGLSGIATVRTHSHTVSTAIDRPESADGFGRPRLPSDLNIGRNDDGNLDNIFKMVRRRVRFGFGDNDPDPRSSRTPSEAHIDARSVRNTDETIRLPGKEPIPVPVETGSFRPHDVELAVVSEDDVVEQHSNHGGQRRHRNRYDPLSTTRAHQQPSGARA